ncbi:DUF2058 domain-containing protein [Dasania marina]|uniref:DUF2058 domain-containing protein n=1 Tax=Dasania marina TaxID=471499 RepID=UPI0030D96874|tara:strand:- start:23585 stop:24118 length:534 start_codon:yes stop_codon:yes gene_type:complete
MASLQDQLLKAGVVDAKKAKKLKQEQRKQAKQQPKGNAPQDETKQLAQQALAAKAAKAKALNKQQQQQAEQKAIQAQIIQLINNHRIATADGDIAYQFTDGKKIKKIYITPLLQTQLSKGLIAIAKLDDKYHLVPAVVADKIKQRDASVIVLINHKQEAIDEDDPYADYQIPDDLMW